MLGRAQSFEIQCISNDAATGINILLPTLRLPAITWLMPRTSKEDFLSRIKVDC